MMKYTLEQIIDLAQNVELGDSIDWNETNLDRDKVYQIITSQVYEAYTTWENEEDKEAIMLASLAKLVVENFVLNTKLESLY